MKQRQSEYNRELVRESRVAILRRDFDPEKSLVTMGISVPDEAWGPEKVDKRWNPDTRRFTMVSVRLL